MSSSIHNNRQLIRLSTMSIGAVTFVALLVGFYVLVHRPLNSREQHQKQRIAHLQQLLAVDGNVHAAHRALRQEADQLDAQIATIRERIPVSPLEETFLNNTNNIAKEEQLAIGNFRRAKTKDFPDYSEVDVVISGHGSYASICRFLYRVSQLERLSTVRQLSIASDPSSNVYPFEVIYSLQFGMHTEVEPEQQEGVL